MANIASPEVKPVMKKGEPVWEIAHLYPPQGEWLESEYLALETNHLIEFDNGCLEFLPMPTMPHQDVDAVFAAADPASEL